MSERALTDWVGVALAARAAVLQEAKAIARASAGPVEQREVLAWWETPSEDGHEEAAARARALVDALAVLPDSAPETPVERLGVFVRAMDLAPAEALFVGALYVLERSPYHRELALTLARDPDVVGVTALAMCELIGSSRVPGTKGLLGSLLPGGRLADAGVVRGRQGALQRLREPVSLDARLGRFFDGQDVTQLWSDPRGAGHLESAMDAETGPPLDDAMVEALRGALAHGARQRLPVRVLAVMPDRRLGRLTIARLAAETGRPTLSVQGLCGADPASALARARILKRDAELLDAVIVVDGLDMPDEEDSDNTLTLDVFGAAFVALAAARGPVVWLSETPTPALFRIVGHLVAPAIPRASADRQGLALEEALGATDEVTATTIRAIVPRFTLNQELVEDVAARLRAEGATHDIRPGTLSTAIRSQLEGRIGDFADSVPADADLSDLKLPCEAEESLHELMTAYRSRDLILDTWGFGRRITNARAISGLFHGPPGTGKTMAASIVARGLGTDLFKVDLSRIVDKYIGETEKHLARIFDEAERGQVVLLFDEADSLFSQRTDVARSSDRYANLEVNFLLQRLESHDGVVLLTTNNDNLIDEAFKRRLRYKIHFPMPDADTRGRIWEQMLPVDAPRVPGIDFEDLGYRFEMSGGHIRNAVLRACYTAADRGRPIDAGMLVKAGNVEYRAMGRIVREDQP